MIKYNNTNNNQSGSIFASGLPRCDFPCRPLVLPSARALAPSHPQNGAQARNETDIDSIWDRLGLRALYAPFHPYISICGVLGCGCFQHRYVWSLARTFLFIEISTNLLYVRAYCIGGWRRLAESQGQNLFCVFCFLLALSSQTLCT